MLCGYTVLWGVIYYEYYQATLLNYSGAAMSTY